MTVFNGVNKNFRCLVGRAGSGEGTASTKARSHWHRFSLWTKAKRHGDTSRYSGKGDRETKERRERKKERRKGNVKEGRRGCATMRKRKRASNEKLVSRSHKWQSARIPAETSSRFSPFLSSIFLLSLSRLFPLFPLPIFLLLFLDSSNVRHTHACVYVGRKKGTWRGARYMYVLYVRKIPWWRHPGYPVARPE